MKVVDIKQRFLDFLLQYLRNVPIINDRVHLIDEAEATVDLLITTEKDRAEYRLIVEICDNGQPRFARNAVARLLRHSIESPGNTYPVFAAPFISTSATEICRQAGVGYIDLAGNCRLAFDGIYIERDGRPNPFVSRRSLRSLYQARSSRVLRALLFDPVLKWKLADLSMAAGVSIGQVFNVKKALIDREWAVFEKDGLQLTQPEQLLRDWGGQYTYEKNTLFHFYSLDPPSETESGLALYFTGKGIRYAFTSDSASVRLIQFERLGHVYVYVDTDMAADVGQAAEALKLKPAVADANVTLMLPYDKGVYFGMKDTDGMHTVSPIQAYLDLVGLEGNGADAAETLFRQVIQKDWQHV